MKGIYEHRYLIAAVVVIAIACIILLFGIWLEVESRWSGQSEHPTPAVSMQL